MTRRLLPIMAAGALWLGAEDRLVPLDETAYQKLIASARGQVLLVNFWAAWCVPCRAEMPALATLDANLRAQGFRFVTVSADEPEDEAAARQFLRKTGVQGTAYLKRMKDDDAFIRSVDGKWSGALPASVLFDRAGRKQRVFIGETDLKVIEAEIRKLL